MRVSDPLPIHTYFLKYSKSVKSQNIILKFNTCLYIYVSNIIGLICDCFLLVRFDLFFWKEIDKKMPIWKNLFCLFFKCFALWIRRAIQANSLCLALRWFDVRGRGWGEEGGGVKLLTLKMWQFLINFSPLFLELRNHYKHVLNSPWYISGFQTIVRLQSCRQFREWKSSFMKWLMNRG